MNKENTSMKKITVASAMGALIEWYDFNLYGLAAALVFSRLYFPDIDPVLGTIAAFGTFAVGFIARPIGGVIFGHFGDKVGRKKILLYTLIIMGGSTFVIGLLPTYQQIGLWAPVLLIVLRILQGIGLGGEYGGAALLAIEHSPREKRGFWGAIVQSAAPAGLLLATGVFTLVSLMPEEHFLSWGWRLPFLISIVFLIVGTYIRSNIDETPSFKKVKEENKEAKVPILELFRSYPKNVLITFFARIGETVSANVLNVFAIYYVTTQVGAPKSYVLSGVLISAAISILIFPYLGALSDRIGRRPIYIASSIILIVFAFPIFYLLNTGNMFLIWIAIILGLTFGSNMMFSIQSVIFTEQFGVGVRYTGISVVYQVTAIIGGFVPMIATSLLVTSGGKPWLIAIFLMITGLVSLLAIYKSRETYKSDVAEQEENDIKSQKLQPNAKNAVI